MMEVKNIKKNHSLRIIKGRNHFIEKKTLIWKRMMEVKNIKKNHSLRIIKGRTEGGGQLGFRENHNHEISFFFFWYRILKET